MLPLSLLKCATGHKVLIELKNGDTYNGSLVSIDLFMNIGLKDAVRTSYDGKAFWQIPETYIRGNTIKYIRVPDAVLDVAAEDRVARDAARNRGKGGRSRSGGGKDGGRDRDRDRGRNHSTGLNGRPNERDRERRGGKGNKSQHR